MTQTKPPGIMSAKRKLDKAVHEYVQECSEAWDNGNPGMIVAWTLGIALTRFEDDQEDDMLMIESAPGTNNYMARGVADATAESFQMQASGFGDMDDDED